LAELDRHLAGKSWLAGGAAPIFADLDVYSVAAYAPQAGYDLAETPNVKAWMDHIEALPAFKGVNDLLPKESRPA
jgi:glutathione S-transferase